MKTLLKALFILLVIALLWWYAYQEGRIQNPQSLLSIFDTKPKTVEILGSNSWSEDTPWSFQGCLVEDSWDNCTTPRWGEVSHSQAVVSYQINADWVCQTRVSVCNDGTYLADQNPYWLETCPRSWWTWELALWCQLGSVLVPEGQALTLYNSPTRDGEERSCDFWERTCTDWELSGNSEFTQFNCYSPSSDFCALPLPEEDQEVDEQETEVRPSPEVTTTTNTNQQVTTPTSQPLSNREPNCPAPFGWWTRTPWQQWTAYTSSQVWYGQTCDAVSIVCAYWSIRYGTVNAPWTIVNTQLTTSCEVSEPIGCTSSCGSIDHNDTVTTYSSATIPHGNGQTCSDIQIVSTCTNGQLFPSWGESCTCQIAPPAGCVAPNGDRVAHESSLTLYQYPQVIAVPGDGSDTCVRQRRQCINGWFYDRDGNRADFTYQYRTCEIVEPDPGSWGWPGGEWIPTT